MLHRRFAPAIAAVAAIGIWDSEPAPLRVDTSAHLSTSRREGLAAALARSPFSRSTPAAMLRHISGCDRIIEFTPGASGNATPIRVIEDGATGFCGGGGYNHAVGPAGDIYVPELGYKTVFVFSPHHHCNVPSKKRLNYVESAAAIDLDAHGNLWNVQNHYRLAVGEYSPSGKHVALTKRKRSIDNPIVGGPPCSVLVLPSSLPPLRRSD